MITPDDILYAIDLFGTASFAFSGAMRVIDRRPDVIGMLILAGATAAGGSILRDMILSRPVMILRDAGYPAVILAATLVTFFYPRFVRRRETIFKYFDAIGLGVFSAITASVAFNTPGMNVLSVLAIACVCGCAGGVVRDLIIHKPSLVLANELYVTPVMIGAACLMGLEALGVPNLAAFVAAILVTTGTRILAIVYDWRLPRILTVEAGAGGGTDEGASDSKTGPCAVEKELCAGATTDDEGK